jgi:peptidoglycan/xylan/chitin deacetylase (PgdA/CDA1 family)
VQTDDGLRDWVRWRGRPPLVLAYHRLGRLPRALDPHNLSVSHDQLRGHVRRLLGRGYEFVTVSEFVRRLADGGPPAGVCALTFDDGSEDNATVLPNVLTELGIPATIYVLPGLLGDPHPFLEPESGVRLMSEPQLRELSRLTSVEIGSHTSRHADLGKAARQDAYREMVRSKRELEEILGREVCSFAYPFCRYSAACPDAARRAGYSSAVTCEGAGGWSPYQLRRQSIDLLDRRIGFALKSRGLFYPLAASPPGRVARWAARPLRHRGAAGPSDPNSPA